MHGTLLEFASRGRSWRDVFGRHGLELDDRIAARYASQAADGVEHVHASRTPQSYAAWEKKRIADMVRAHGVGGDVTALVDEIHAEWLTWTVRAYPEVPAVLTRLRAEGVPIVVCTNWTWDAEKALAQAGLLDLVDGVAVSARVGARKPHPRAFQAALELAGVPAESVVFVGDDWRADVLGSVALGMTAFHVDRRGTGVSPLPASVVRSHDLGDLPGLFRSGRRQG